MSVKYNGVSGQEQKREEGSNMKARTESGTIYEFDGDRVRRVGGGKLRQDGEWLNILVMKQKPVVGKRIEMLLEPLFPVQEDEGEVVAFTMRTTTPVVEIWWEEN